MNLNAIMTDIGCFIYNIYDLPDRVIQGIRGLSICRDISGSMFEISMFDG